MVRAKDAMPETPGPSLDVEAEIDHLYCLPLPEFVQARNGLAAKAKTSGDKAAAARVKALPRPSVPAWAANQVFWRARAEFDALLSSMGTLQAAQASGASGASLREAMRARREAQAAVMARAQSMLLEAGHDPGPAVLQRVSNTLEALVTGSASDAPPGRLVHDLEPPGFEALAQGAVGLSPAPRAASEDASGSPLAEPKAEGRPSPEGAPADARRSDALERARAALAEAERKLEEARRAARAAAGARSVAETRAEGARAELADAQRRLERTRERAEITAADETEAQAEAKRLEDARDAAEAARDAALRALREHQ